LVYLEVWGHNLQSTKGESQKNPPNSFTSRVNLRSKRFRGVGEKRKNEECDLRCFVRAKKWGGRQKKEREEQWIFPLPSPLFPFLALAPFFARTKHRKSRFSVFFLFKPSETRAGFSRVACRPFVTCLSLTLLSFAIFFRFRLKIMRPDGRRQLLSMQGEKVSLNVSVSITKQNIH